MAAELQFYLDEHIPRAVAEGLQRRGIAVITTLEAGRIGANDREQLEFTYQNDMVLVTQNADFLRLHQEGVPHAGIVYCRQQVLPIGEMLRGLILIHAVLKPDDMKHQLEFL